MCRKYGHLIGVGGIGSGMFFRLRGNHTLGRNESRAGAILRRRDFCKLHIVAHYVAVVMGANRGGFGVFPVGKVGDDPAGREMIELMRRAGLDTRFVSVEPDAATLFSVCFVYEDGEGGNITNDDSATSRVSPMDVDRAMSALAGRKAPPAPGVALAVPEAPLETRLRLLELAPAGWHRAAAVTTAEAKRAMDMGLFAHADVVSVNLEEAAALAGVAAGERADAEAVARSAGERLAGFNPAIRLCVTAGAGGMYGWERGRMEHVPACPTEVVSTAGAGDAVLSALIVAEVRGLPFVLPDRGQRASFAGVPLATALDLASLLAALAVSCEDTINFGADAAALAALARRVGADESPLRPVLEASP